MIAVHETGKGFWTEGLPGLRSQPGGMPENIIAFNADQDGEAAHGAYGKIAVAFGGRNTSGPIDVATARNVKGDTRLDFDTETFIAFSPRRTEASPMEECSPTINAGDGGFQSPAVAFTERTRAEGRNLEVQEDVAYALTNPGSGGRTHSRQIAGGFGVRRLTPTECERLQGFPDGWTDGQADSTRYRQLGNAVAVPVVEWIGRRIVRMA